MWDKVMEIYARIFFLACASWILLHLILILLFGQVVITEDCAWVLWSEVGLFCGIVALAVERLIKEIKNE